jgi:diguanylate cyclase (GGDEF)-like protein
MLVLALNANGFNLNFIIALQIAAVVPFVVAPLASWYLIGLMLRIYRMEKEMRKLASYDSLTGLLSRHAFFSSASNYVSLAKREHSVFSVLIVDLDYFKSINDLYGHPAGDAVLKLFGTVTDSVSRQSDIVGRLGGEEFALLLPSTTAEEAVEFAQRLHEAINKAVLKYKDAMIKYTASIGLTSFDPHSDDDLDTLLARADSALYQAKRNGRNQTAIFSEEVSNCLAS